MSDPSKICLTDSPTVAWNFDLAALEADALVSQEAGNLIEITSDGLLASYRRRDVQRYAGATAIIPTGAQQTGGGFSIPRFNAGVGIGVLGVNGLYHVTAVCTWQSSAAGTYRAIAVNPLNNGVQYPHVEFGVTASTFASAAQVVQFDGILPLTAGSGVTFLVQHDVGANLNILTNEFIGVEAMCNLLMEM